MKTHLLISILLFSLEGQSQIDTALVKLKSPSSVHMPKGYSQVAIIDIGRCYMIIISGQVSLDRNGNLVGKDNLGQQTEQVFQNIKNILLEFGGSMSNLIRTGIYMVDISKIPIFREVRNRYINLTKPPTSTLVQVSKLYRDDILIEIEATAIIPKK